MLFDFKKKTFTPQFRLNGEHTHVHVFYKYLCVKIDEYCCMISLLKTPGIMLTMLTDITIYFEIRPLRSDTLLCQTYKTNNPAPFLIYASFVIDSASIQLQTKLEKVQKKAIRSIHYCK